MWSFNISLLISLGTLDKQFRTYAQLYADKIGLKHKQSPDTKEKVLKADSRTDSEQKLPLLFVKHHQELLNAKVSLRRLDNTTSI